MHIIKWFVEKAQKLVWSYRGQQWRNKIEREYVKLISDPNLTEEQYDQWLEDHDLIDPNRQRVKEYERDYLEQCRKEDEREAKQAEEILQAVQLDKSTEASYLRELEAEALRAEELRDQELVDEWQCQDCGGSVSTCTCTPDDDKPEIPQMGLPGHEEEEIPLWLEHANEECPNCGLLPEFGQCQYEE